MGDGFRLADRAIFATDGPNLESDSAAFRRPDAGHRTSPWFRVPLKLHTVDEARNRYRAWAASEWERINAGPATKWLAKTAPCTSSRSFPSAGRLGATALQSF